MDRREFKKNDQHIIIWSDNCMGQNSNMGIVSPCYLMLEQFSNLRPTTWKVFLGKHARKESDNVHAVTEKDQKKLMISI